MTDANQQRTVGQLIATLEQYDDNTPVVIEAAGVGIDDRSYIYDVMMANYQGADELHLVSEDGRD